MKIYLQNGYNKVVRNSCNYSTAAKHFLKELVISKEDGSEICELAPITFVSKCGFMEDIVREGMEKEYDEIQMIRTATIFDSLGRHDIGRFLRKQENSLPKDMKKLVKML